ncbi:unnamed protein product [Effrenium voratum]|nr:unnamed protein product [Effrenium voratum]
MRTGLVSSPPDLSHTDLGQNIPDDPTERVEKAGALLEDLGRSLRTVRSSADELANAGAILAEKGDRLADVATYIREAKAHSGKMQEMNAEILKLVKGMQQTQATVGPMVLLPLLQRAAPPPRCDGRNFL